MHSNAQTCRVGVLVEQGILEIGDGYRAKNAELGTHGLPFARVANINGGFLFDSVDRFPLENLSKVGNKVSKPGDVVFTSKGTVGRFAFVTPQVETFVYSPQLCFWRSTDPNVLDPRFLYFWMQGPEFMNQVHALKGQTDMADYVSLGDQRTITMTLPSLRVQQHIGTVLGAIEDRMFQLRQTNAIIESIAQSIFQSWFIDFDPVWARAEGRTWSELDADVFDLFPSGFEETEQGLAPRGWRIGTIRETVSIFDSKRVPLSGIERAKRQGPYPYYGAAAVMDYVDDYLFEGVHLLLGEDGSVVNRDGTPVMQYVWGKFWVNNHAHVLQGANGLSTEYVMMALRTKDITSFVTGAVQAKLNQANLFGIPVLIPDLRVASAFSDLISPLFATVRANSEMVATLAEIRDTLLPRLISGQLRIPDAEKALEEAL